jgi:hypothetical protein
MLDIMELFMLIIDSNILNKVYISKSFIIELFILISEFPDIYPNKL